MLFFKRQLMPKENILVVTDDFNYWIDYFEGIYNITYKETRNSEYILRNNNLRIIIKKSINPSARGYRWNKIFIDKIVDREILNTVIKPKILQNIYYNEEYLKNQME